MLRFFAYRYATSVRSLPIAFVIPLFHSMVRFFERRALCFRYGIGVRLLSTNITRVSLTLAPKRTICNWLTSASAFFLTDPLYFGEIGIIRLLAVIISVTVVSVFRTIFALEYHTIRNYLFAHSSLLSPSIFAPQLGQKLLLQHSTSPHAEHSQ